MAFAASEISVGRERHGAGDLPGAALATAVELLCRAIGQRRMVGFRYGANRGLRRFAPRAVYAAAGGRLFVTGIQMAGPSRSGVRDFAVSGIAALTLLDRRFKPVPAPGPTIAADRA